MVKNLLTKINGVGIIKNSNSVGINIFDLVQSILDVYFTFNFANKYNGAQKI